MFSPRACQCSFASRAFCTVVSKFQADWLRRSATRYLKCFLLAACVITVPFSSARAQATAASRWANVSAWKGMVSVSGDGSGSFMSAPDCTNEYSNNQTINRFCTRIRRGPHFRLLSEE
jgi:hypothetical protein